MINFKTTAKQKILILFTFVVSISTEYLTAKENTEQVFTDIYKKKHWGTNKKGEGVSGPGSRIKNTEKYRELLQNFLKKNQIHSVVDVGCGDWQFSRVLDWKGIDYIGYDVVGSLIKKNREKFGAKNIHFRHANGIELDLPKADLLICKDVLQHLTNEDVHKFISQFHKFKYCLITNDVNPKTLSSTNPQIERGGHRNLDLSKPPFSLKGEKVLDYWCEITHKMVFLIKNTP